MADDFDWNDLRAFLALARTQRLGKAARRLGVDQSTLSRRIGSLETALNTRLFDRKVQGHSLTPAGMGLLNRAEAIESLTIDIHSSMSVCDDACAGTIRVATPEGFGTTFLAPRLAEFGRLYPNLEIELIADSGAVSLPKREADLAVTMVQPAKARVRAHKLTDYELGLYAAREYLQSRPIVSKATLGEHRWIGYVDDLLPTDYHTYLRKIVETPRLVLRISNVVTQLHATREGAGICILPCFMAQQQSDLLRILPDEVAIRRSYWLVVHEELRSPASGRAVGDYLARITRDNRALFLPG